MKNKTLVVILRCLGITLILLALGITIYNLAVDYLSGKKAKVILDKLDAQIEDRFSADTNHEDDSNTKMPAIDIDGKNYIGIITIPSLNIKLPVLEEYSKKNMKIAPVLYKGTIYQKNAIIAAHSYVSQFKHIQKLKLGDQVLFENIDGHIFKYEVIKKERLSTDDVELMESGEWDLTLFTCTTSNANFRATVRLKLLDE